MWLLKSKINRRDIGIAEVHDCFSIAEIWQWKIWDFGKKEEADKDYGKLRCLGVGKTGCKHSGGLKAAGHPVTTGIKQIGEIFLQLTKQAKRDR